MFHSFLPPDDLPSLIPNTRELCWELDEVVSCLFYNNCDLDTQKLLSKCGWDLTTGGTRLTLTIICPTPSLNWKILQHLLTFAEYLQALSETAKILIYPPPGTGGAMEMLVNDFFYQGF